MVQPHKPSFGRAFLFTIQPQDCSALLAMMSVQSAEERKSERMASRAGSRGNSTRKEAKKRPAKAASRKSTASQSTTSTASASPSSKKPRVSAKTKKNLRRAGAVVAGAAAAAAVGAVIKKVVRKVASKKKAKAKAARPAVAKGRKKVEADIPMDRIENAYTPTQTSLKGPFRATGKDRSRDQEFARGVADDKWRDEDVYTNKSGDPRIGTHGRTYEPKEKSGGSRSDENR